MNKIKLIALPLSIHALLIGNRYQIVRLTALYDSKYNYLITIADTLDNKLALESKTKIDEFLDNC